AVVANDADELARLDIERDVAEREQIMEATTAAEVGEPVLERCAAVERDTEALADADDADRRRHRLSAKRGARIRKVAKPRPTSPSTTSHGRRNPDPVTA